MFLKRDGATNTRLIAVCGLMVAVAVAVDGFFKIPVTLFGAYALKVSLGIAPILFLSVRYGPLLGGACGAVFDVMQALLFPVGAFNPLFTVSAFVSGFVPGLFFVGGRESGRFGRTRLFLAILCGQALGSVLLGTWFLVVSYGLPWATVGPRALTQAISVPVYTAIVALIRKAEGFRRAAPAK
jgi:ECF transporter S component (folate family)